MRLWIPILLMLSACSSPTSRSETRPPVPSRREVVIGEGGRHEVSPLPKDLFDVADELKRAFLICPGDQIQIRLVQHDDFSVSTVVPPDGTVGFPMVGRVKVAGRAPSEIETDLVKALRGVEFADPQVIVSVVKYAPRTIYILGEVESPGGYPLRPGGAISVQMLLAMSGGLTEEAERGRLELVRRQKDKTVIYPFSLTQLDAAVKEGRDVLLLPGDVVIVKRRRKVYVMGCVRNPGGYVVEEGAALTRILAKAGGLTRMASPVVRLIRRLEDGRVRILSVDVRAIFDGRETDPEIRPGDTVFAPESLF